VGWTFRKLTTVHENCLAATNGSDPDDRFAHRHGVTAVGPSQWKTGQRDRDGAGHRGALWTDQLYLAEQGRHAGAVSQLGRPGTTEANGIR
jgi:hypothetical protein